MGVIKRDGSPVLVSLGSSDNPVGGNTNVAGTTISGQSSQSSQSGSGDKVELIPITLEELKKKNLLGATVAMDLEEDAWESSAPPPAGRYTLRLYLGQKGLVYGYQNPKKPVDNELFVSAGLECRVVSDNPDYNGSVVFAYVNTRVYRGKQISTMIGLLAKAKMKIPKNELNVYEQVALFSQFLKREPTLDVEIDWRASYKKPDGQYGQYENALKHYREFPNDPDRPGFRQHIVNITRLDGGTEECKAQVYIDYWYSKGEGDRPKKQAAAVGANTSGKALEFVNSSGVGSNTTADLPNGKQVVNGPVQQTLPGMVASDEDLALLLSE